MPAEASRFVCALEPRRLLSSGLFSPPTVYADHAMQAVTTGDFDGNGTTDVAAAGSDAVGSVPPGECFLQVLLNDGAGHFTSTITPIGVGRPKRIAAAQLDDDAREDVAVFEASGVSPPRLQAFTSLGDGRFVRAAAQPVVVLSEQTGIASADFNGDGRRDLLAGNMALYHSSDGASAFEILTGLASGVPADTDGDGDTDVVAYPAKWINDGAGHFTAPPGATTDTSAGDSHLRWAVGDFDHDGRADLVNGGYNGAVIGPAPQLYFGRGNTYAADPSLQISQSPSVVVTGDFDGDGTDDFAMAPISGGIITLLSRGDGTFRPAGSEEATVPFDLAVADLNADGRADLLSASTGGLSLFYAADAPVAPLASFGAAAGAKTVTVPAGPDPGPRPAVTFTLKGPGVGRVYDAGPLSGLRLVLDGTSAASSLTITTPNGTTQLMNGVRVNGSIRSIAAPTTAFFGDFDVTGTARSIVLAGAQGGSRLTLDGTGSATSLALTTVRDLTVASASPIDRLSAYVWKDLDLAADVITAPSVGAVVARPPPHRLNPADFAADFNVTAGGIRSLDVRGTLNRAVIRTAGSIGAVKVRTADECVVFAGVAPSLAAPASAADFVADASIGTFRARSTFGTLVAARSVNRYQVGTVNRGIHELPHGLFATAVGSYARGGDPPVHTSRRTTPSVFDESDLYVAKILS